MSTTTDTSHRRVMMLALRMVKQIKVDQARRREEWEMEAAQDYREGHTPHYCIHGVNQWVDYDCACWACEELGWNVLPNPYQVALSAARSAWAEFDRRWALTQAVQIALTVDRQRELSASLRDWCFAPLDGALS